MACACPLAFSSAGTSIAISSAIIAITTKSSIRVNALVFIWDLPFNLITGFPVRHIVNNTTIGGSIST
ncbi:MAG: hypothetical protein ACYSSN_04570 [Planctomycetota bacterium]|jgi:hypothetical protein